MKTEIKTMITVLNSTIGLMGKYPFGNKELTIKTRELESQGLIRFNIHSQKWEIRPNKVF